jgi:hypothetical protein
MVIGAPAAATELMSTTYTSHERSSQDCRNAAAQALLEMHMDSVIGREQETVLAQTSEFAVGVNCSGHRMLVVAAGPHLAGVKSVLAHFEFVFHGRTVGPKLPKGQPEPRI